MTDVDAPTLPVGHPLRNDVTGVIAGIIQNLDLQPVDRPIKTGYRVQKPLSYETFIEDGQLNGYQRQVLRERGERLWCGTALQPPVCQQPDAMQTVQGKRP
jgi:hypothetical protein